MGLKHVTSLENLNCFRLPPPRLNLNVQIYFKNLTVNFHENWNKDQYLYYNLWTTSFWTKLKYLDEMVGPPNYLTWALRPFTNKGVQNGEMGVGETYNLDTEKH